MRERRAKARADGETLPSDAKSEKQRIRDREWMRQARAKDPERHRKYAREYMRKRRQSEKHRIDSNAYRSLKYALNPMYENYKSKYFPDFDAKMLRLHFSRFFDEEVNLYTYGIIWEIDHKVPVCKFSYKSIEDDQYKECWSINNLRPLKVAENREQSGERS